uniref:cytochrome c oxidase subunit 2 n=1 Tax=Cryptomonas gyropyrenoidosa TaxID=233257 RepID=UPI0027A9912D|nr:cytochrome c oxidase subunit 2 [Cryptomonas gyropyrenoidosa]WFQ82690.1 cytochrome c oxidase subunit 2 [Cryptomonas gyropyrenoidosa]
MRKTQQQALQTTYIFFIYTYIYFTICNFSFLDYAHQWQISFQDPATPIMEGIIALHHDLMFVLSIIGASVIWLLLRTAYLFYHKNNLIPSTISHGTTIEIVWTVTPSIILMVIAIPSFALLYSIDEIIDPAVTLKAIGHQWYWSYEYSDYSNIEGKSINFDSYMINDDDLQKGQLRLLEVDNRVILPSNTHIRVLITATDVLHSWAIPSLGIKMDACPGRLNQVSMFIKRNGVFYGQCSEICGIQHGFMPIVVEAILVENYIKWVAVQTECKNWLLSKFVVLVEKQTELA